MQRRQPPRAVPRVVREALRRRAEVAHGGGEGAAEVRGDQEGAVVVVVGGGGEADANLPRPRGERVALNLGIFPSIKKLSQCNGTVGKSVVGEILINKGAREN
jgi:hypothetical protein